MCWIQSINSLPFLFVLPNSVKEILKLCPARVLITLYKLLSFDSVDDFLQKVATICGKLKKGGIVDVEAAARIVLHDWNKGMLLGILKKGLNFPLNFYYLYMVQCDLY